MRVVLASILLLQVVGPGWTADVRAQSVAAGTLPSPSESQLDLGFTYDDNVTRARDAEDTRSDQFLSLGARTTFVFPLAATSRLALDAAAAADLFHRFTGLSRIVGELAMQLEYRGSPSFHAPTFALFARGSGEQYDSTLRTGYRYAFGVSVRQPVTDRITLSGVAAHNVRNANSAVFDTTDNSFLLNLDYATSPRGTLFVSGEYRRGDAVSTGRPTLSNLDIAEVFVADDVFTDPQMFSYRFDADTVVTTLGYNIPIGASGALELVWRWAHASPRQHPGFAGASTSPYIDNQVGITYLFRF